MKNTTFIKYEKAAGRESLFFGDSSADFYVLYEGKLYQLRKQFLAPSSYFARKILKKHRVHVIENTFKSSAFEKILSCFYGLKCIFERGKETEEIMKVIKFLECRDFQQLLRKEIVRNFNEYEIFFLLDFANKFNDNQLQFLCHQELIKQNFQQFNFSRFELLKCREEIFVALIKLHQKLKRTRIITGLTFHDIRKIILEYNTVNQASVDLLTVLMPPPSSIIVEDPEGQKESPLPENLKKLKKVQTMNLNNSYNGVLLDLQPAAELAAQFEQCCLSQCCHTEKKGKKKCIQQPGKIRKAGIENEEQQDEKEGSMEGEIQTEPQQSLQNSERISLNGINGTIRITPDSLNPNQNKVKVNMFCKKKRSGSTNFAQSVNLLNCWQFYKLRSEAEKQEQPESAERLIKSQTIETQKKEE